MRALPTVAALLLALATPNVASAFCGFYVSGADAKLTNRATHVALLRAGTRTVISMQNAYEGPPEDFAMVVPVPVVLQKEQVKTLPPDVLGRVDQLGAPRLVEYWEEDPCGTPLKAAWGSGVGQGFGSGAGRLGGSHASEPAVKIEAEFTVGEYDIVILSATDSTALDRWLRDGGYKIPEGAEPYMRPYVASGMKFFVAKVNMKKVEMKEGRAALSPLRFHYDAETFSLPIRLGLINSADAQDLIVSIVSDKRYEVANYPNVMIPTNLDVSDATRASFGTFYGALFDEALRQKPGAVVTEYAWDAGTCDPCPGPAITARDVATLGGDAVPEGQRFGGSSGGAGLTIRMGQSEIRGRLPPEVVQRILRQRYGRFRLCYEKALGRKSTLQGTVTLKLVIGKDGEISGRPTATSDMKDAAFVTCVADAVAGASFPPPEAGQVSVSHDIRFSPNLGGAPTGLVLTRLHMRYSKDALGEDLVFKEAPAITGGREVRGPGGAPEQGAALAGQNNFQARYAIRHPWTGPIACNNPVRGRWGGPPEGAAPAPVAARDLAFVARGGGLGTFLSGAVPPVSGPATAQPAASAEPAPTASAAPPAASASAAPAPASGGGCGCSVSSGEKSGLWIVAAALTALLRRRRAD